MILGILGSIGSGKTLFLTYLLKKYSTKYQCYANYHTKIDNVKYVTFEAIENMEFDADSIIALDEVYILADSRLSISKQNRIFSHLIFQSRKRNFSVFYTAQLHSSVEKRLRTLTDVYVYADKIADDTFRYLFVTPKRTAIKYIKPALAYQLYPLYDTKEIVKKSSKQDNA